MAKDRNPTPQAPEGDAPSWKAALPFIIAGVVVLVVVIGVLISNAVRPAEDRMSEDAKVQHAINDYYTARNEADFDKYAAANCAAARNAEGFPAKDKFVTDNRKSMDDNGQIKIPEITDLTVNGDRATARVHWHFEKSEDKKNVVDTTVVREDGEWKVCTS
ncbi:MAG: hypothetical protein WAV90_08640 [Gordonia amarae]